MMMTKKLKRNIALLLVLVIGLTLAGCSRIGEAIDPRDWGYDSQVIYHAMGGMINTKEIRETYYMTGSLIFEPRGTTNMLIQPVKDGYILAGWYRGPDEPQFDENNQPVIEFNAQDRWDFNVDRVEESMTLYARWIEQGVVEYVDIETEEIMFTKNITADSPVQPLTPPILRLIDKPGQTMEGYYEDKEGTTPYDFTSYVHGDLLPSDKELYDQLYEEFPDAMAVYDGEEILEPIEEEPEEAPVDDAGEEEDLGDIDQTPIDPYAYLKRMGYQYTTEDEAVIAEIQARKKTLIEESIQHYAENTAGKTVWLKYTEGRSKIVNSIQDLELNGRYGFFGSDNSGQNFSKYVIQNDLDFNGRTFDMVSEFTGTIDGGGHTLANITIAIAGRKMDQGEQYRGALFGKLSEAEISDLTLQNVNYNVNLPPSNHLQVAAFAVEAESSTVTNVKIDGVTFNLGRGDNGLANYEVSDFVLEPGDSTFEGIEVTGFEAESSHAEITKTYAD